MSVWLAAIAICMFHDEARLGAVAVEHDLPHAKGGSSHLSPRLISFI
jgi:hypothetical protein